MITPFSKRTPEDIYIEYFNDWLTVSAMAENYGRTVEEMNAILIKGRDEHMKKFNIINSLPSLD